MLLPSLHSPSWGIGTVVLMAALAVGFSFFFVAVSARTVGIVGQTSQPVSGMTITAVLASSLIIAALGYTGIDGRFAAMTIGAIVCISICLSGDMSQDLKTGALVGATPKYIQYGQMIGTVGACGTRRLHPVAAPSRLSPRFQPARRASGGPHGQPGQGGHGRTAPLGLAPASARASASWSSSVASARWRSRSGSTSPSRRGRRFSWEGFWPGGCSGSRELPRKAASHERGTLFASGLVAGDALMGIGLSILAVIADQLAGPDGKPPFKLPFTELAESYGAMNDIVPLVGFAAFAAALVWVLVG